MNAYQFVALIMHQGQSYNCWYFILHMRVPAICLIFFYDYRIWFESLLSISLLLPPNLCDEKMVYILCVNLKCLERLGSELFTSV